MIWRGQSTTDSPCLEHPENTMAAFRHAISHGIPIELDVQLARADLLVVVHDRDLLRLTGAGMAAADVDLDLLSRLRIGSSDERIPLLPDVLAEVGFTASAESWSSSRARYCRCWPASSTRTRRSSSP